jgi:hypothetical protein
MLRDEPKWTPGVPVINETRIIAGGTAIKLLSIKSLANISTSRHNPGDSGVILEDPRHIRPFNSPE